LTAWLWPQIPVTQTIPGNQKSPFRVEKTIMLGVMKNFLAVRDSVSDF
jgi:hypothetical protein